MDPKIRKQRTSVPSLPFNPFSATGFETKYRTLKTGQEDWIVKDTGEALLVERRRTATVLVDTLAYTKFFHNGIDKLLMDKELTLSECRMLMYIGKNLKPKQDEIFIDIKQCTEACKWKNESLFYTSARGLIAKGIIAKSSKGNTWYWINPDVIYNGNRDHLAPEPAKKLTKFEEEDLLKTITDN